MSNDKKYQALWNAIHEFNHRMDEKQKKEHEWFTKNVKLWDE